MAAMTEPERDPVLARRALVARLALVGQRVGYLLYGASVVLFVIGFIVGFTPAVVTAIVTMMIAGSALLAPAIVAGYAVKAAAREDRERGR
jgi:hypothetical protein